MRIAFALMSQESNSFNPVMTPLERFDVYGRYLGADVLEHAAQSLPVQGFVDGIAGTGVDVEIVPIMKATALAGGPLTADALATFTRDLVDGLATAGPLDGIGLLLHGACVAENDDDVEGHLLEAVRRRMGDEPPIVVGLDHHANITTRMITHASAIIGHRTQPHDTYDTGRLTAELIVRVVADGLRPTMAWRKLRLLSHQEQYLTAQAPMKTWFDRARDHEQDASPVVSVSPFPMQPWLDVDEGGWSVVVVTDGAATLGQAEAVADELADLAWSMRADFQVISAVPASEAVAHAANAEGFVVISDTGDSAFGGAGADSTVLLQALLDHGAPRALVPIVHPPIAAQVGSLTVGQTVRLEVGGAVTGWWDPIVVEGVVVGLGAPHVRIPGSGFDSPMQMGPSVALEVGNVTLVVSTLPGVTGNHPDHYANLGVDVAAHRAAVLKTASNFQFYADFDPEVIRADTPGPTQSRITDLEWTRVPRPIYPLDER